MPSVAADPLFAEISEFAVDHPVSALGVCRTGLDFCGILRVELARDDAVSVAQRFYESGNVD